MCLKTVVRQVGGAHRSGARNIEDDKRKLKVNAPKLNCQLLKICIYLLTLSDPAIGQSRHLKIRQS
jgi:hypothetical protein